MKKRNVQRRTGQAGFTVAELLVYMVVAVIVIAAIYNLLISQNRLYSKQREVQDVRTSIRAAANLLAWEFRQASASAGDLYAISDTSFTVRSVQGSGFVCAWHATEPRIGLASTAGDFYATADDSMLVYTLGGASPDDDAWVAVAVDTVYESGGLVPNCAWPGSPATDVVVEIDTTNGSPLSTVPLNPPVDLGSMVRQFRKVEFGIYQEAGRWWLGRKVGAGSYEKLTGPLSAPADSGLIFVYRDDAGAATSDPAAVAQVDIILRGESYGAVPGGPSGADVVRDTMTVRVSLRN